MKRKAFRLMILALPAVALTFAMPQPSQARNLFDILFGRKKQEQPMPPVKPQKIKRKKVKATTPQPKQNPKAANATRILVVGDFVAGAVVDGLNQIYANNPDVVVIGKTDANSGLVREDRYNWPTNLEKVIEKEKPDVVVVTVGANDNQPIKQAGKTLDIGEADWSAAYKLKVSNIAGLLKNTGKPFLWMGQPAFKNEDLFNTMVVLNAVYKQEADKAGGRFVDVWDGFVDDQGKFSASGYDVNGKTVRLRANDGINFTPSGKQKLAFYLEKPLEAYFQSKDMQQDQNIAPDPKGPVLAIPPRDVDRLPAMNITDMARQNNGLLGDIDAPEQAETNANWTPKNGHQTGRADNFATSQ